MDFQILRTQNLKRNKESFPSSADWTASDWATALAGKVGELCNIVKKHRRGDVVLVEDIGKELADVIVYADLTAYHFKIDLAWYVVEKFNEVSERIGSQIRLSHVSEAEFKTSEVESFNNRLIQFIEEQDLKDEFEEWNRDFDIAVSN